MKIGAPMVAGVFVQLKRLQVLGERKVNESYYPKYNQKMEGYGVEFKHCSSVTTQ